MIGSVKYNYICNSYTYVYIVTAITTLSYLFLLNKFLTWLNPLLHKVWQIFDLALLRKQEYIIIEEEESV